MAEFSAQSNEEWALRQYLHGKLSHVSVESIVSGPGLAHVYRFLIATGSQMGTDLEMAGTYSFSLIYTLFLILINYKL